MLRPLLKGFGLVCLMIFASPLSGARLGSFRELVDLEALCYPDQSQCLQVSSYDRTGGNDDGFSGAFSFVRKDGNKLVIFDEKGPGCIYRIWSANPPEAPIRFYLDGEAAPQIEFEKFTDMFADKKAPFVRPFSQHFIGGFCSYVPIPFRTSCRIEVEGDVRFYQITWRKFPAKTKVKTYGEGWLQKESEWIERATTSWDHLGQHPMALSRKARTEEVQVTVLPGTESLLFEAQGPGMVRSLRLSLASKEPAFRRLVLLQAFCDGTQEPFVNAPVGDFFLDGFGAQKTQSLALGTDPDGVYYCFFPMPFDAGIRLVLKNEGAQDLSVKGQVVVEEIKTTPPYRFYAHWRRENPTREGELFTILETRGQGQWLGVSTSMQGDGGLGFLEGDEMMWVDGRDNTSYNGTGSEDYYNGGWYFGVTGSAPSYGCGYLSDPTSRCHAFRLHISDRVPFQERVRIGIEHGHGNSVQADYSAVSFWYGIPGLDKEFQIPEARARLVKPYKIPGVLEAESLPLLKGRVFEDQNQAMGLSSGQGLCGSSEDPIGQVSVQIEVQDEMPWILGCAMPKGPGFVPIGLSVDGIPLPQTQDLYAAQDLPPALVSVFLPSLGPGKHELSWFRRPEARATNVPFIVDYLTLAPMGLFEVEKMETRALKGEDKVETQDLKSWGPQWSNNAHRWLLAHAPDSAFEISVPSSFSGTYALSMHITRASDYGVFSVSVGDQVLSGDIDGYAPRVERSPRIDLGHVHLSTGINALKIQLKGKNPASSGFLVGLDELVLRPVSADALEFEAEHLQILEAEGGPCSSQDMKGWGQEWGGNSQLWFRPSNSGGAMELLFPVFESGTYGLVTDMTQAPNYAVCQVLVDGTPLGQPFDAYVHGKVGKTVKRASHSCGQVQLNPGWHSIRFAATGKAQESEGYYIGIDRIRLTR